MTHDFPLTSELLRAAGVAPNVVPIQEDAITKRGILVWTGNITANHEAELELMPWPDESWADIANELLATFEDEWDLNANGAPR